MSEQKRTIIEAGNTYKGRQSWNYREIYTQGPHKIRVSIKVDSYNFQSHAKVEVWHGAAWSIIHTIPYSNMASIKGVSYVDSICKVNAFAADRDELVEKASQILF